MKNILEVKELRKNFAGKEIVRGLSFDIKENEVLGFLGPNGAGKSTTINMIATILEADGGEILFQENRVNSNNKEFKKSLGLVPQDIAVFLDLTAYENVKFFASLYGIRGTELKIKTDDALKKVGLYDRKNEYPDAFSGGMKRRLNIACAIVHKPKILIMDEPTVGIDPQSRNNILEVTKELNKEGTAVIYTSHYMEEVEAICSRIIVVDNGQIIEQGNKEEIKNRYKKQGLNNLEEIFLYITGKELRD